jgi:acetyl esterase
MPSDLDPGMLVLLGRVTDLAKHYPQATTAVPALSVQHLRASYRDTLALLGDTSPLENAPMDLTIPLAGRALKARLYVPDHLASHNLVVYFHGGGWVMGDLDTHDHLLRYVCGRLSIAVVSVDYRLAPEHACDDICADANEAVTWLYDNRERFGCKSVATAGDSSGAYLAALAAANHPTLVKAMLLLYPVVQPDFSTNSYLQRGGGPGLTADMMRWFWRQFMGHPKLSERDEIVANLLAHPFDSAALSATIISAWHDPLHDGGRAYASHLRMIGQSADDLVAFDMPHGFARYWAVNPRAKMHLDQALSAFSRRLP